MADGDEVVDGQATETTEAPVTTAEPEAEVQQQDSDDDKIPSEENGSELMIETKRFGKVKASEVDRLIGETMMQAQFTKEMTALRRREEAIAAKEKELEGKASAPKVEQRQKVSEQVASIAEKFDKEDPAHAAFSQLHTVFTAQEEMLSKAMETINELRGNQQLLADVTYKRELRSQWDEATKDGGVLAGTKIPMEKVDKFITDTGRPYSETMVVDAVRDMLGEDFLRSVQQSGVEQGKKQAAKQRSGVLPKSKGAINATDAKSNDFNEEIKRINAKYNLVGGNNTSRPI